MSSCRLERLRCRRSAALLFSGSLVANLGAPQPATTRKNERQQMWAVLKPVSDGDVRSVRWGEPRVVRSGSFCHGCPSHEIGTSSSPQVIFEDQSASCICTEIRAT